MKIYIASSWKNVHAVEMLTTCLRVQGHTVMSFVEFEKDASFRNMATEQWINTESAKNCFTYDSESAMASDLVIYISPSGKHASAELGMAYAKNIPIIGLYAKGEDLGIMRHMFTTWYEKYKELLEQVKFMAQQIPCQ